MWIQVMKFKGGVYPAGESSALFRGGVPPAGTGDTVTGKCGCCWAFEGELSKVGLSPVGALAWDTIGTVRPDFVK